jgi:hypothetical protein
VGALSEALPTTDHYHWQALTGVVRYVKGTADRGVMNGGVEEDEAGLVGYCDADHGMDQDDRKSMTGYVFLLDGGAISWQSKKQNTVATSSTEAEYMAVGAAVREALWLRKMLSTMRMDNNELNINRDRIILLPHHTLSNKVVDNINVLGPQACNGIPTTDLGTCLV